MPRKYHYVGPRAIAERLAQAPSGVVIASSSDLLNWVRGQGDRGRITATFVIDGTGRLRLADRHSEHVACAGGEPVLAAGEITLNLLAGVVTVDEVSNQSTGYCPEPESWAAVAGALTGLGIQQPISYTTELLFRRCPRCGQINVIKDQAFECAVCGASLPASWNCDSTR